MKITKSAGAFFDVRLLEEDGVRPFFVSGRDVEAALFEEGFLVFLDAFLSETGLELIKERLIPGEKACVEKGGSRDGLGLRLLNAFCDVSGGREELKTEIPDEHLDGLDQLGIGLAQFLSGDGTKKEEINIRSGIHNATTISAIGNEGDLCFR